MRLAFLRSLLPLAVVLTGCAPGKDIVDERALQARLDYQSTRPTATATEFAPKPSTGSLDAGGFIVPAGSRRRRENIRAQRP